MPVSRATRLLPTLAALALAAPISAVAQVDSGFALTIPSIMRGPELVGREPDNIRWSADGRWIYFEWLEPGAAWNAPLKTFRVRAQPGATPEPLTDAQLDTLGPPAARGILSLDGRWRLADYRGDLYLADLRRGQVRRLTRTVEAETPLAVAADRVVFQRGDNAFALELAGGTVRQLTDLRAGPAPKDSSFAGQRAWLRAEERRLIDAVREQVERDSLNRMERLAREERLLAPSYLDKGERVAALSVAPGEHALLVVTRGDDAADRNTQVPRYVTEDGYVASRSSRAKVGDAQSARRLGWLGSGGGAITWLEVLPKDSAATKPAPPADIALLGWEAGGTRALVSVLSPDFKARTLYAVSADSGRLTTLDVLQDSAWVGGPCWRCGGWLPGGRAWFVSEATGYAHLYTVAADGSGRRALTDGTWEVLSVELLPGGGRFLVHTSEGSPYERHAYFLDIATGRRTRLTSPAGGHEATLSPDGTRLADVFSQANRPPELYLQPARAGAAAVRLTESTTAEWRRFGWLAPEIIEIPASDGALVPARIYRPADLGAAPNGAAVIFVHGAGYLHNVHRYWSSYFREYMFHHLLAQRGYLVLDLDYRASAGYGRDWRTAIYRHMGGRDLQDQVDASRWLQAEQGIGPDRVGIYGGSYGGFITLMALFTAPERFGAGAALRSVTDWAHYNHGYTGRILNLPQGDSVAYRRSSPIYFAEGLADPLLMAHGMVDANVQFQDIVRLTQRLIELGKTDWELAVYPVEDHGFVRPSSWADEYRRILALFDRHLLRP